MPSVLSQVASGVSALSNFSGEHAVITASITPPIIRLNNRRVVLAIDVEPRAQG